MGHSDVVAYGVAYGVVDASEPAGSAFLYRLGPVNTHFMRPTTQSFLVFEDAIVVPKSDGERSCGRPDYPQMSMTVEN